MKISPATNIDDVLLAEGFPRKKYVALRQDLDSLDAHVVSNAKTELISFVKRRFDERYFKPLHTSNRNGFTMMAICCLSIETLSAFELGLEDTDGISKAVFISFFLRTEPSAPLYVFKEYARDFYSGVRCGILHQAETTEGWRIMRRGDLLNKATKTINAAKFLEAVEKHLDLYCERLDKAELLSPLWKGFIKKLEAIARHPSTVAYMPNQPQDFNTNTRQYLSPLSPFTS